MEVLVGDTTVPDHAITRIQTWDLRVPLPTPLVLRDWSIKERSYTGVRLETRSGHVADVFAVSRALPLDVALHDLVAPVLLGRSALDLVALTEAIRTLTPTLDGDRGFMARCRSIVEVLLTGIRSQVFEVPIWRLLGGSDRRVPILLVEGYPMPDESDEQFVGRTLDRIADGYRLFKWEVASYRDLSRVTDRLELLRSHAGFEAAGVVLDFGWTQPDVRAAAAVTRQWQDLGIEWAEDMLPRGRYADMRQLRESAGVPIGQGDEVTDPRELTEYVDRRCVDLLRADALVVGGFAEARQVHRHGHRNSVRPSLHVNTEVHQHLVFGDPMYDHLELIPYDRPFDPANLLMQENWMDRIDQGHVTAPEEPGLGIRFDDDRLRQYARRSLISEL